MRFVNEDRLWCIWGEDGEVVARFPNKEEAQAAFDREWSQEDCADQMEIDRACKLHPEEKESECACWMEAPYEDARDNATGYGRRYPI